MAPPVSARVQKRRDALRMAGLRPIQIWVPDTRRPSFAAECRRQSKLAAQADRRTGKWWISWMKPGPMSMAGQR